MSIYENPMYFYLDQNQMIEVSGNDNDTSGDAKIDSDVTLFLCLYSSFAIIQIFFLVVIFKDKALRENNSNWSVLAAVIAMFINMIFMMTTLIGTETSAPSWNNIIGLCYPFTIIQLASNNWPMVFLIVTIIGCTIRCKKGDPNAPAFTAKRTIINLIFVAIVVTIVTCIIVFGLGDGHRINTTMATNVTNRFGKDFCYVYINARMRIARMVFQAIMLMIMITTYCCLVRAKINHYTMSACRQLLDSTTTLLLIIAIWFFLNLPFIVIAGMAGDNIMDVNGPLYPHVRASRIVSLTTYGMIPALWVWLDPDYRASTLQLFQSCLHCLSSHRKDSVHLTDVAPLKYYSFNTPTYRKS